MGDAGEASIAVARARLLRAGAPLRIERCGTSKPHATAAPVASIVCTVHATRIDATHVQVKLVAPKEPLAWAIDTSYAKERPFTVAWHGERAPGARPIAAPDEAIVEAPANAAIAVRVYGDDGSVGTKVLEASEISAVTKDLTKDLTNDRTNDRTKERARA